MITAVLWKWRPAEGYRSTFTAEHVDIMARMLRRNYRGKMRVVCVTDDPEGIRRVDQIIPLWSDHSEMKSPHDRGGRGPNPSCYRRLKIFSADAGEWLGERILSIDLDCVITGDLTPLLDRPEDFVIWGDTSPNTFYNGGLVLLRAGARRQVWDDFDPVESPKASLAARQWGSDQGWIGARLGPDEAKFGIADGVYSYRNHIAPAAGRLPDNARIVSFHGRHDPWSEEAQRLAWVREHYR